MLEIKIIIQENSRQNTTVFIDWEPSKKLIIKNIENGRMNLDPWL